MNKQRRKEIRKAIDIVSSASEILSVVRDEEQAAFDNLSEGLQSTQNGQNMDDLISVLDDFIDTLENFESDIGEYL